MKQINLLIVLMLIYLALPACKPPVETKPMILWLCLDRSRSMLNRSPNFAGQLREKLLIALRSMDFNEGDQVRVLLVDGRGIEPYRFEIPFSESKISEKFAKDLVASPDVWGTPLGALIEYLQSEIPKYPEFQQILLLVSDGENETSKSKMLKPLNSQDFAEFEALASKNAVDIHILWAEENLAKIPFQKNKAAIFTFETEDLAAGGSSPLVTALQSIRRKKVVDHGGK